MGEVQINIRVQGAAELTDALHPDNALALRVKKHPGACPACAANEDPERVPVHTNPPCRCEVVFVNER